MASRPGTADAYAPGAASVRPWPLERVACLCGAPAARPLFVKHGHRVVRCRSCGLAYVDPRPPRHDLLAIYREQTYYRNANACAYGYGDYVADHRLLEPLAARRLADIETRRPERGRLLDVGCATGVLLDVARAGGWDVTGVDVSDYAVDFCRSRGLTVHHGDVESARFPSAHFDVVVMDDTVEHLADPRATLAELARLLVPGGLVTTTRQTKLASFAA